MHVDQYTQTLCSIHVVFRLKNICFNYISAVIIYSHQVIYSDQHFTKRPARTRRVFKFINIENIQLLKFQTMWIVHYCNDFDNVKLQQYRDDDV